MANDTRSNPGHPFCRLPLLPLCRGLGRVSAALLLLALLCAMASLLPAGSRWAAVDPVQAASGYNPPSSGLDPPGGPKPLEGLPGKSAGRTAEGGMGYTDAYGNTIENHGPEEKPAHKRPRPGAYGANVEKNPRYQRPLPDPQNQTPAWSFK